MNETTRVITLQVAVTGKADEFELSKEEFAENVKETILELGADDVEILSVQDFTMDKKGE